MITEVILPKQGLQMEEGLIVRWHKAPGDAIAEGEPVVEIETDKVTMDVEAPTAGVLLKARFDEGLSVPVGETIAWIGDAMDEAEQIEEPTPAPTPAQTGKEPSAPSTERLAPATTPTTEAVGGRLFSTPRARLRADERGVTLETVAPTGPDGLIIERDVLGAAATGPSGKRIPFDRIRRTIADRMLKSMNDKAQITHTVHLDMSRLVAQRATFKDEGTPVSYNDLLISLCAQCLSTHPVVNRQVIGDAMIQPDEINIGFAVAIDEGLLVPVVKNADRLTVEEVAVETRRLIEAARAGTLSREDMEDGTFTISNLGMYGIDEFQAIINPPQSAILAVGRIADRVWAVDGTPEVRPVCTLTLTYDHCVMDGATAAAFMKALRELIE